MNVRRNEVIWGGAALAAAASGVGIQRHHMRRIAADPAQAVLRDPPQGRRRQVPSADGTALNVEEFGPEHAENTIVLIHGWTESLTFWIHLLLELPERGFRVVAYDLRGHGESDPAEDGDYSIPRFGQDLDAVLTECVPEGQRVLLVGHSLGAMSIVSWAEQHEVEDRVYAAALLNTGMGDLLADQILIPVPWIAQVVNRSVPPRMWVGFRGALPRFSTPLSYAAVRYLAFGGAASPAHIAFFERMLVTCPPDVRADVGMTLSELDLVDALPHLTVPTLVIAGDEDKLTPQSHAKHIAEALPRLERMIVLERTGHMAPLERPEEVIDAVAELAAAHSPERVSERTA